MLSYKGGIHTDYGIITRVKDNKGNDISGIPSIVLYRDETKRKIDLYINSFGKTKSNEQEWADLSCFWFVSDKYIDRALHDDIVNRDNITGAYVKPNKMQIYIGGFIKREKRNDLPFPGYDSASKKIFSFHGKGNGVKQAFSSRCFGYTKQGELDAVIKLIEGKASYLKGRIKKGKDLINEL